MTMPVVEWQSQLTQLILFQHGEGGQVARAEQHGTFAGPITRSDRCVT